MVRVLGLLALASACAQQGAAPSEPEAGVALQGLTAANCPAGTNIIQGSGAADTLIGTAGNDCLVGLGGNDTLQGLGGNDFLIGGNGADSMYGGDGDDQLYGEAGNDPMWGGAGNDLLNGGNNPDTILGEAGDDTIVGEAGDDQIDGGDGRDSITGDDGIDTIHGGANDDVVHGNGGNDFLYGDDGDDVLDGDGASDTLWGGNGDDAVYGDVLNDTLNGEAGDDALIGGSGTNVSNGGPGIDACTGTACEKPELVITGCTQDAQCDSGKHCIVDFGLCLGCVSDQDGDSVCDSKDGCVTDPAKAAPGVCGCGVADTDSDGDGTANCNDGCPNDAGKVAPGVCGCGVVDTDSDNDGTANCSDGCPSDAGKVTPGVCGCGTADTDGDNDGTPDCNDGCPSDAAKVAPGVCGCGTADTDSDNDGTANCNDGCPNDAGKVAPGVCGCGTADTDSDNDGTADCNDECPSDAAKVTPGVCGCGTADTDSDNDGTANCNDGCPNDAGKVAPGVCGCGVADTDSDGDTTADCNDVCPGQDDRLDTDMDGIPDGCDDWQACVPGAIGVGVYDGSVTIGGPSGVPPSALAGISCVTGDLWISDSTLTDLSALSDLRAVGGYLSLYQNPSLQSVDGLQSLTTVGAGIIIGLNSALSDLSGLSSLESMGAATSWEDTLDIRDNAALPGCWAWMLSHQVDVACGSGYMPCSGNTGQGSCGTLPPDFQCVPGAEGPGVYDGDLTIGLTYPTMQPGTPIAELGGLTCVTGNLWISNSTLTDLSGLSDLQAVGGYLNLYQNASLQSVDGLQSLTTVGAGIIIGLNDALSNLSGLSSLESMGAATSWEDTLDIRDNAALPGCWAWMLSHQVDVACGSGYMPCSGNTGQGSCGTLPPDFACVPGAEGPGVYDGDLTIGLTYPTMQPGTPIAELGGLTCVTGNLHITNNSTLTDLSGLSDLQAVGGYLNLYQNASLQSVDGLQSLTTVGAGIIIGLNDALSNLSGLSNLENMGAATSWEDTLDIRDNAALPGCWAWMLSDQVDVACGSGYMPCSGNTGQGSCGTLPPDFACVPGAEGPGVYDGDLTIGLTYPTMQPGTPIAELGGLTCVTGNLHITNNSTLTDLSGLSDLQAVGGYLNLYQNASLQSVDGLQSLTAVGAGIIIGLNDALSDLSGLSNLESMGAATSWEDTLDIRDNAALPGCWAWMLSDQVDVACGTSYMPCSGNTGAGSCGTLPPDFQCVPGAEGPGVYDGDLTIGTAQFPYPQPGTPIAELGGLTCVTGNLQIYESTLTDLSGLSTLQAVGGYLDVRRNDSLLNVDGLQNLTSVGAGVAFVQNDVLSDLQGLTALEALGASLMWGPSLEISDNPALPGCWAWLIAGQTGVTCGDQYYPCSRNTGAGSCGTLPPGFVCEPGAVGPGVYPGWLLIGTTVNGGVGVDPGELGGITCVPGDLQIRATGLTNLTALSGLQMVYGYISISANPNLTSVDGLESLVRGDYGLYIYDNPLLENLAGLSALTELSVPFGMNVMDINDNDALPACWVDVMETQTGEVCGHDWGNGWVDCSGNDGVGTCGP